MRAVEENHGKTHQLRSDSPDAPATAGTNRAAPDATAPSRLRSSLDHIAVGIAHTTTGGRILEVNQRLCEMLGYSAAELLGRTIRELTHADDPDQQESLPSELISGARQQFTTQERYRHKSGGTIWVKRTVAMARDAPDSDPYLIQTIDRIDEYKSAESKLENSLSLLQATLDSTADGILVVDTAGQVVSYNQRLLDMWRIPAENARSRNVTRLLGHAVALLADPQRFKDELRAFRLHPGESSDDVLAFKDGRVYERHSRPQMLDGRIIGRVWSFLDITARAELERSFELTFNHAAVGMIVTSLDKHYVSVNRKFADMLGYERDELKGMPIHSTIHPDDRSLVGVNRQKLASGELKHFQRERRYLHKDGRVVWARQTISMARDGRGQPQHLISVIEDITERKEIEMRYQETFDQIAVGILHTARDGTYLRVNRKFCEMLGYTEAELLGRKPGDFSPPGDREEHPNYRQLMWEGKLDQYVGERRYLRKDGGIVWANRTVSLARDASGKPLYFIRVIEDISERKQAAELMARERTLLRTIIDSVPDHIYVKDRNGKFVLANRAWLTSHGEQEKAVVGKTVYHYFSREAAVKMSMQDQVIMRTGKPLFNFEQKLVPTSPAAQKNHVRWAATTKVPLRTADGEITGTVGISRDITEEKLSTARRSMSHVVTRVLTESTTLTEAMPAILQTICEAAGWAYGARWAVENDGRQIRRREYWCDAEPDFDPAERSVWSALDKDAVADGFLHRAWIDSTTAWITDPQDMPRFRRKASLARLGWHSGCAFPIEIGSTVIGVLEFFGPDSAEPDEGLLQSVTAVCRQIGQFIQRKEAEDKLVFLAQFDTVTGLPNRHLFIDRLEQLLNQSKRNDWTVSVLFIDLDRFKAVNDTYGHAAGDELLRQVAARMSACVRSGDTVGRLSGDEFAVILSNLAHVDNAVLVAQKIIDALSAPFELNGNRTYISASIGIALHPADGDDAVTLLKNADTAMYRAKEQGRNGYQFYLPQMNERLMHRQMLATQLHGALDGNEFLLHYQPKVSLVTGAITGFEALLRWQRDGQPVPSIDFIPILEETGLITSVGEWILKTACKQLRQWEQQGIAPRPVAVNVSARQFQRGNLVAIVQKALHESGIKPGLLKLELTESLLMSDAKEAVETLHQLKALGVQLSVDDFGTGYSSLAYLKRFPLDELKIDREFIRDAVVDPDDATIVLSIINLAHSLKLRVVAEGVETEGQLAFLRQHGCDEIQGYYFSRPQPATECSRMLSDDQRLPNMQSAAGRSGPSMLLVVDNEHELELLIDAYTPAGYRVMTARNAEEGFEILARHRLDIVISDNDMPAMSGVEFLARVRKLHPDTMRVLASSGDDTPTLTRATNKAGIHLFLPKSWSKEKLCSEMHATLQTHAFSSSGQHPVLQTTSK